VTSKTGVTRAGAVLEEALRGIHLGIGGAIILGLLSLVFHQNFFQLFSGTPLPCQQRRPILRAMSVKLPKWIS
jgi:hypothetical protein